MLVFLTLNMSRSFEVMHCKHHNQSTEAYGPLVLHHITITAVSSLLVHVVKLMLVFVQVIPVVENMFLDPFVGMFLVLLLSCMFRSNTQAFVYITLVKGKFSGSGMHTFRYGGAFRH